MATTGIKKSFFLFAFVLLVCGLGIFFSLERGQQLAPRPVVAAPAGVAHAALKPVLAKPQDGVLAGLTARLEEPLSRLFIQLLVILVATRAVGALFRKIGQPAVVGEMFAGVLLGPSLFGWLFPGTFEQVFPAGSLGTLKLMSQIGVCLFMFVVGMDLDMSHLRTRATTAILVSHISIVFPYFLGVAVSLALYPALAGPGVPFVSFALFLGISMSITAFPVLARILQERKLDKTWLGGLAITCAAVGDVTAWSILAFVVAIARSTGVATTLTSLSLVIVFTVLMFAVVKPRVSRWLGLEQTAGVEPGKGQMAAVLVLLFGSALATEVIGVHALFGAFLAGVVMPTKAGFREFLKLRIENFSSILLLPLFFAFNGLRTHLGLLGDTSQWLLCLLIIGIATLGKLGGTLVAARFSGVGWADSFALGALMNTRGLMELIAINIGLDLGILSPEIFAMLVIMALGTTFMTGPLLTLADHWRRRAPAQKPVYP